MTKMKEDGKKRSTTNANGNKLVKINPTNVPNPTKIELWTRWNWLQEQARLKEDLIHLLQEDPYLETIALRINLNWSIVKYGIT